MASESPRTPPPASGGPALTRRSLLKTGAGAIAGGAVLSGADVGPVGEAEAIPPLAIAGGAALAGGGAGAIGGWLLRDHSAKEAEEAAQDLSADLLEQELHNIAETRKSTNASTFIDNENILDGAEHVAYADAKIAAIEALNDEDSESDVTDAANAAVDDYETTIVKNFLKSWNESISEVEDMKAKVENNDSLSVEDVFENYDPDFNSGEWQGVDALEFKEATETLPDSSDFTLKEIDAVNFAEDDVSVKWSPISQHVDDDDTHTADEGLRLNLSAGNVTYLKYPPWNDIYNQIADLMTDVRDGISLWVSEVYADVQSGELDTADLLTPRELAELSSEDQEDFNQAAADLMALNVPYNPDIEAEVALSDPDITLVGSIHWTAGGELSTGDVDISEEDGDFYITYDVAEAEGTWGSYDDSAGIDGGVLTFIEEPLEGVEYDIHTSHDEVVTVVADDFEKNSDGDEWTVDLSDDLENSIADVDKIEFFSPPDAEGYETVRLNEDFEIVEFTDDEGKSSDSATYEQPAEPESDDNYITEEEWKDREESYQERIDKFEEELDEATAPGGGMIGDGLFDLPDLGLIPGVGGIAEWAIVGVGTLIGINVLTD